MMTEDEARSLDRERPEVSTIDTTSPSCSDEKFKEQRIIDYNAVARHYTGINKYIIILLYCIPIAVASSIYFNWSSVSRLLIRAGIYEWHCSEEDLIGKPASRIKCEAQRLKISHLLVLTRGCDMAISAVTGFLVDRFSQRYVLLTGNAFLILGWLTLAFNCRSDALVTLAFCCIGFCASCIFMSVLNVINLFSDNRGLAICFVVSVADDISTNIPLILNGIFSMFGPDRFDRVCLFYVMFAVIPTTLIGFTAMPVKSWTACIKEYELASQAPEGSDDPGSNHTDTILGALADTKPVKDEKCKSFALKLYHMLKPSLSYLSSTCFMVTLICFIITNFSNMLMTNLFLKYYDEQEEVLFVSEIFLSAQFIPGIILGYLFDRFPVSRVNYTLNAISILAFWLLHIRNTASGYIFCFFQAILICVDFSTLMVYINLLFPGEHMSTITGVTLFLDGMVSLLLSRADEMMLEAKNSASIFISIGLLVVRLMLFIYLHFLMKNISKSIKSHISDSEDLTVVEDEPVFKV